MVQYRDLNAPPERAFAEIVAGMNARERQSKTGDAGVKDLGEAGDVVWPRPDGTAVSVRDIDAELVDAVGRIEDAEQESAGLAQRVTDAEASVGAVAGDLTTLETITLPGAVAELESADQANAQAVADAEARSDQARADLAAQIDQDIADAADALSGDINSVRTSVDGKSKITQSLDAPPAQYAGAVGDRWERMSSMGSGGRLISNWRWNGTVWVSTIIDGAVLGNVDASTISAGFLDSARIKAGSIYADKIVSGLSQNMVPDAGFSNPEINATRLAGALGYGDGAFAIADGVLSITTGGGAAGHPNVSLATGADRRAWAAYPAMKIVCRTEARVATGTGQVTMTILFSRRDGSVGSSTMTGGYQAVTAAWGTYVWTYDLPQDVVGFSITVQVHRLNTNGTIEFRSPFVAAPTGTTLIEPGAITTDRLAANSVVAGKIASGAIETQHLKAGAITVGTVDGLSNELAGKETPAGAQAKADAAKTEAEQAAAAAAEVEYGETKTLVGGWRETGQTTIAGGAITTDSITSGHLKAGAVTTEKLTVTEDMSAAIVNAMSVNAKKLVVTEEAVLNHATLIGQTVVDDINVQGKLIGTDGVFTGTVDFENVNVSGEQIVNKLAAGSISAEMIEGGSFTGETFEGGTFTGGLFKTSDALPGQVELADDAYVTHLDGGGVFPGVRITPIDTSQTSLPAAIGPSARGLTIFGGRSITGESSIVQCNPNGAFLRTFRAGGGVGGVVQTSPTESLMRTYREDGGVGGAMQTSPTESLLRTYREDGGVGGVVQTSPTESLMRTYREDGTMGGEMQTSTDLSFMRAYSGNSSESGWVQARPQDAELAYVAPDNTYFSQIKADASEAFLFTRAGGARRYLSVDANGVWVKTNKSGSWESWNLEETANDTGWINFNAHTGISTGASPALRLKGGIVWAQGYVTRPAGWPAGWTRIAGSFAEWLRPTRDILRYGATTATQRSLVRMTSTGYLEVWWSAAAPGDYQVDLSVMSYPNN